MRKNKSKKLVQGVGHNDYPGRTHDKVNGKQIIEKFYTLWLNMLNRCYNKGTQERQPRYVGCSVCEDWKSLSKFKDWFDLHYVDGWVLDKDLLNKDNKVYGPENCVFIPGDLNLFLTENTAKRGDCMIGVKMIILPPSVSIKVMSKPRIRYVPTTYIGKCKTCDTELEAHMRWKRDKNTRALEFIDKYPMLSERAKGALRTRYDGDGIYDPLI